jgi:hypothetical protein
LGNPESRHRRCTGAGLAGDPLLGRGRCRPTPGPSPGRVSGTGPAGHGRRVHEVGPKRSVPLLSPGHGGSRAASRSEGHGQDAKGSLR